MRLLLGHWKRILSKAMYQILLQNSEDITLHYFPEKLLLTLKIVFMGCIVFLYLLMLLYCFLMLTSLDSPLCFSIRKFTNSLCSLLFVFIFYVLCPYMYQIPWWSRGHLCFAFARGTSELLRVASVYRYCKMESELNFFIVLVLCCCILMVSHTCLVMCQHGPVSSFRALTYLMDALGKFYSCIILIYSVATLFSTCIISSIVSD